jgi:prepilin-type N-terminal cleavage/methylation domain-containing protein
MIKMRLRNRLRGVTLIEVLIAAAILAFSLCGILLTYINMFIFTDLTRDFTLATNALQAKAEEIKKANFDNLLTFNGSFDIAGFASSDAKGVVYITSDTGYADLKRVRIEASFKSRNRVIGGDKNLNGIADLGEDVNSKNELNSPAELVTLIAK